MTIRALRGPGFLLCAEPSWCDVTADLDVSDRPFTLGRSPDGVGSLQFSAALYRSGPVPDPTLDDLQSMVRELAREQHLGEPLECNTFENGIRGASGRYLSEGDLIQVWYVSDGKNVMLVSYVCAWEKRDLEAVEVDAIVRSVQFGE